MKDRYTRVAIIPGKTYQCGCDVQRYTALLPNPHYVNRATCRTHGQPIAVARPAPPVEDCPGCDAVWCVCNRVSVTHV